MTIDCNLINISFWKIVLFETIHLIYKLKLGVQNQQNLNPVGTLNNSSQLQLEMMPQNSQMNSDGILKL